MYKIDVLEDKKVVHVVTNGFIKKEEAVEIISKLKHTFQSITTSKYYLVLDSSDFKTASQNDLPLLKEVIDLYDKTPFIKKFFILPNSPTAKMQVNKIDSSSLPKYMINVNSFDEAISMIK